MKIQSRFKDYYDYIAHLYGDGDPRVPYVREPLTEFNAYGFRNDLTIKHQVEYHIPDFTNPRNRLHGYQFAVLVIMDRPFLAYRKAQPDLGDFVVYDFNVNPLMLTDKRFKWSEGTIDYPRGLASENILALTKKVGAPVYLIRMSSRYTKEVYVQSEIPNLGKMGVASFYPAQQLYQDLAYFVGNTMKDNPDTKPPVEVDNLTRLQQYGFDKKISFRHRR